MKLGTTCPQDNDDDMSKSCGTSESLLPFRVSWNDKRGRVLLSNNVIEPGVNVIVEHAYSYCTHHMDEACHTCLRKCTNSNNSGHNHMLLESKSFCDCGLLFCSNECLMKHHEWNEAAGLSCVSYMNSLRLLSEMQHVDLGLILLIFRTCVSAQISSSSSNCWCTDQMYSQVLGMVVQQMTQSDYHMNDRSLNPAVTVGHWTVFDLVLSLETHSEDIDPEHLFTFKKCAERLNDLLRVEFSRNNGIQRAFYFDSQIIINLFCIIFVNAHGLCSPGFTSDSGTGLFPVVSLISHDCNPNCCFVTVGHTIFVRSVRRIEKDEELSISYIDLTRPTYLRRRALLQSKYFVCECTRCKSPSECHRYVRAYKCDHCQQGFYVPIYAYDDMNYRSKQRSSRDTQSMEFDQLNEDVVNFELETEYHDENYAIEPMNEDGDTHTFDEAFDAFDSMYSQEEVTDFDMIQHVIKWYCDQCSHEVQTESFESIEREVKNILRSEEYNCQVLRQIIEKYSQMWHKNHYLLFDLHVALVRLHEYSSIATISDKMSHIELEACYEYLIQYCSIVLPEHNFEIADYCMRYALFLETNNNKHTDRVKQLRQKALDHHKVIYPSEHSTLALTV